MIHAQTVKLAGWCNGADTAMPSDLWDLTQARVLLPAEGTGSRTALSHHFRRNRLSLDKASSLPASHVRDYLGQPGRRAIFPEVVLPAAQMPEHVRRLPFDFGTVQLCILRSAQIPMTRPAQLFLTLLQLRLIEASPE